MFSRVDVFGPETYDDAASIVARLHKGEPVPAAAVAERLKMSKAGTKKALRTAQRFGMVLCVVGKGWLPAAVDRPLQKRKPR